MTNRPTILIIFGITGDLARRYILPAIPHIAAAGKLPEQFRIVGVSRRDVSVEDVLAPIAKLNEEGKKYLVDHLEMFSMDLDEPTEYERLKQHLGQIEQEFGVPDLAQYLFYLSVPPQFSQPITRLLGASNLAAMPMSKLLLEKPFGTDHQSAKDFIEYIRGDFQEEQVYRIDHYLAKEMAQNLIVFRDSNSLFKRTWNNQFIEQIDIIASEEIGIEGRAAFYEHTGALRDIVQSHLLQLAALTLMELPTNGDTNMQPYRLAALKTIQSPPADQLADYARRGQYTGYAEEVKNPGSTTETFVSLVLSSTDPRWQGVPITITTGKSLALKTTEIRIHYRQEDAGASNQLILRVQPQTGIQVCMWTKRPGYERQLEQVPLSFTYDDHYNSLPDAYEQVLVDAIRSDHSLFASSDEVLESWRILAPIQHAWSMDNTDMISYQPGSSVEQVLAAD